VDECKPLVHGAREMVKMARQTVDLNFPEPSEIAAAEARWGLADTASQRHRLPCDSINEGSTRVG
jgi:hypothetical protein